MCHLSTSLIDSYDVHLAFKVHLNIGYNCPFRGHIKPLPTSNASQTKNCWMRRFFGDKTGKASRVTITIAYAATITIAYV